MLSKIWMYFWAYLYEVLGLLDKAADWAAWQIDHNDYLAGVLFVVVLFEMVWFFGFIDVIWR